MLPKERSNEIDLLRFIAALAVVFVHYAHLAESMFRAQRLYPALSELARRFAKQNHEDEQELAALWAIRLIPNLILFHDGHEAARTAGALPLNQLQQRSLQQGV